MPTVTLKKVLANIECWKYSYLTLNDGRKFKKYIEAKIKFRLSFELSLNVSYEFKQKIVDNINIGYYLSCHCMSDGFCGINFPVMTVK